MGDRERTGQPVEEERQVKAEDVPGEEGVDQADVDVKDVDMDPEDHVNRPDQADFDPAERDQYDNPPRETSLADADRPEDR
jgi:hypothetical protein